MAPSRKDKTKSKKVASEKKLSDVGSKESKKEPKKSTKTPSSEKATREKRKKSSTASAQKKRKHLSTLNPLKVRLLDGKEDYLFTNKNTSKTEDKSLETGKKIPTRKHGDNNPSLLSSPAELRVALTDMAECLQQAKAAKHFKVPKEEQEHWMSTYAHIVRDGLGQKRNACSQDLRKTLKSKYQPCLLQGTCKD
jgi:hypothetical protein